jgi:hypothetical protein
MPLSCFNQLLYKHLLGCTSAPACINKNASGEEGDEVRREGDTTRETQQSASYWERMTTWWVGAGGPTRCFAPTNNKVSARHERATPPSGQGKRKEGK